MTNNNLKKNVISAIKSCELEGFVYTKEEKQIFPSPKNMPFKLELIPTKKTAGAMI